MPNIASLLKDEIARVSRKELRGENQALKKASSQYRTDIAALKRRVMSLERLVTRLAKGAGVKPPKAEEDDESSGVQRFSAKGLAAQRRRLGLSAADVALLLGVSALSVYKWEGGKTRPRESQMAGIGKLRSLSKSQAAEALETLKGDKPRKSAKATKVAKAAKAPKAARAPRAARAPKAAKPPKASKVEAPAQA